jgi:hypothetical protein
VTLATGCGGPSHSGYVKRADAICAAFAGTSKPIARPRSYTEVAAYVRKTLPLYEAALRKLEALDPPPRDADGARRWLAADRRVARAFRRLGEAADRRDFPAVTAAVSEAQLAGDQSRRAAAALGTHVCAEVPRRS